MSGTVESNGAVCFYSVLGIGKHSSEGEIRCAYRKMALVFPSILLSQLKHRTMFILLSVILWSFVLNLTWFWIECIFVELLDQKKWHPDRGSKDQKFALEAKKQFQHVQEAYSGALLFENKINLLCDFYYNKAATQCLCFPL